MIFVCLFDLILYVPSTIFQLNRDESSWVEPVQSQDKCVLLKDHNTVTPVRLEPTAPQTRVKHSTTEPLRSLHPHDEVIYTIICCFKIITILIIRITIIMENNLSHAFASGSDITPCNKINKPLVVYRFSNVI